MPIQFRMVAICCGMAVSVVHSSLSRAQEFRPGHDAISALKEITSDRIASHIRFLSDDLLEGRGPASRGDQLTQAYVASQFQGMGLKPMESLGWFQKVPLVGVLTHAPQTMDWKLSEGSTKQESWKYFDEYIATAGKQEKSLAIEDSELVFVGYGIQAPEYQWDDFKGVDLRGKILLMMNNDPSGDPNLFAGKRRLYYGRWDYKYESAARQGAVGAIIIHTTESAGYPFKVIQTSWTGEEFELEGSSGPRLTMKGWATEDAAKRLVAKCGKDLDTLRQAAESRDFRPVSLGAKLSIQLQCDVRKQETANVLGWLEGSDSTLRDQPLIYMAHHDHIGMAKERNASGDMIYNGAIDNASGLSTMLSIAAAYTKLEVRPKRSILFAAVGAEEQGLLGSKYLAEHPPLPPGKMAAVINIDGIPFLGKTHDVNVIGGGKSDLDELLEKGVRWQNRVLTQDHFPDRGYYYRSDQFSLAKIGVPAIYLHSGTSVVGRPDDWGRRELEQWIEKHYHQPSDEYNPNWDLSGAVEDAQLLFIVGNMIANQKAMPAWKRSDEFEAARNAALKEVQGAR